MSSLTIAGTGSSLQLVEKTDAKTLVFVCINGIILRIELIHLHSRTETKMTIKTNLLLSFEYMNEDIHLIVTCKKMETSVGVKSLVAVFDSRLQEDLRYTVTNFEFEKNALTSAKAIRASFAKAIVKDLARLTED